MALDADGPVPAASITRSKSTNRRLRHELIGARGYGQLGLRDSPPDDNDSSGIEASNEVRGQECDGAVPDDHDIEVLTQGKSRQCPPHHRHRFHQDGVISVHRFLNTVHQALRHGDAIGEGAGTSESDLVVGRTAIRCSDEALIADAARDDALNDDALAGDAEARLVIDEKTDPLVTEDQGIANVGRIDAAVDQLEVGSAHAREQWRDEDLIIADGGRGQRLECDVVR